MPIKRTEEMKARKERARNGQEIAHSEVVTDTHVAESQTETKEQKTSDAIAKPTSGEKQDEKGGGAETPKAANGGQIDFSKMKQQVGKSSNPVAGEAGVISLVNSAKNGKRISIPHEVFEELGSPSTVNIVYDDTNIYIGEDLPNIDKEYKIRLGNKNSDNCKKLIYCGVLISELTKEMGLDYSDSVCKTFHDVEYLEVNDKPFAVFNINGKKVR